MLRGQPFHRYTAGDRQAIRMVRDGVVFVSERDPGVDDVAQRLAAVAVGGMHLQVAAVLLARQAMEFLIA